MEHNSHNLLITEETILKEIIMMLSKCGLLLIYGIKLTSKWFEEKNLKHIKKSNDNYKITKYFNLNFMH